MLPVLVLGGTLLTGCSQTTGTSGTTAAVTPSRSDFVDAGQPIALTGASLAGSEAGANPAVAGTSPAETASVVQQGTPAGSTATAKVASTAPGLLAAAPAEAATAIIEPQAADVVAPDPQPAPVMTLQDDAALQTASTASQPPADAPGGEAISASAKAKLVSELQALKKRPGADAPTGKAKCADGSTDADCGDPAQ